MAGPITIADLENAKVDVEFIADFANATDPTAVDRLGRTRRTIEGVNDVLDEKIADVEAARVAGLADISSDVAAVEAARAAAVPAISAKVANIDAIVVGATDTIARNIGSSATDPTVRLNGSPLQIGDYYFNTTANATKQYGVGGVWGFITGASAADVANAADAAKGAALVGFNRSLTYAAGNTAARELMRARGADDQLVGAGDSIQSGMTSPNTYSILTALKAYYGPLSLSVLTNTGVPGSRLDSTVNGGAPSAADMVVRYATNVYPKRPAATNSVRSILFVIIGANDYLLFTTSAHITAWCASFDAYCAQARADGFIVIAQTIMRRTGDIAINATLRENNRLAMNDFIRRSRNVDGVVDAGVLLDPYLASDAAYFIDGTHPNDLGNSFLARATASVVARVGLESRTIAYPPATTAIAMSAAAVSTLEAASIVASATNNLTIIALLIRSIPAFGTSDFTVCWWSNRKSSGGSTNQILTNSATDAFGLALIAPYIRAYRTPGTSGTWGWPLGFSDAWEFHAISRTGTDLSYWYNGKLVNLVTGDTTNHAALTQLLQGATGLKIARLRTLSRGYSAADVALEYASLGMFRSDESAYTFALDDGRNHAGNYIADLSPTRAHVRISDTSKIYIQKPNERGTVRFIQNGSMTFPGAPLGSRISSWTAKVTTSGGGAVNLGDVNNNGSYFNAALAVGTFDLTLVGRYPTNSATVFANSTGYVIEHTIQWEQLR